MGDVDGKNSDSNCFWCLEWHDTVDSTMTRARELVDDGSPPGTVVVTDFQFAGRGTRGRTWEAPPSTCLMFTIALDPKKAGSLELLPIELGERIAARLTSRFGLDLEVKPPNDLLINGRKICGILCSSRIRGGRVEQVLCGIGLNTHMDVDERPIPGATSLAIEGCEVPPHDVLLVTWTA